MTVVLSRLQWQRPKDRLLLSPGEVHVWRVDLGGEERMERLGALLSEEERGRADRYHFPRDRRRFILGRGTLRCLLGRYLDRSPVSLQFSYGPRGKPILSGTELSFNVSHSQDLALIACTWGRELGVDLEYLRPMRDLEQLSRRFFSPQEHQLICDQPTEQRLEVFFRIWTAKEACLKALGEGLIDLEHTEVTLTATGAQLVRWRSARVWGSSWELRQWIPVEGAVATLAVERSVDRCLFWEGSLP